MRPWMTVESAWIQGTGVSWIRDKGGLSNRDNWGRPASQRILVPLEERQPPTTIGWDSEWPAEGAEEDWSRPPVWLTLI